MGLGIKIYKKLPVILQNMTVSAYGIKRWRENFGHRDYKKWHEFYMQTAMWSEDQLLEWQLQLIKDITKHCQKNVPYYRKLFKEIGFNWQDIKSFDDFKRIPITQRDTVAQQSEDFLAENYSPKLLMKHSSGGSTGKTLHVYHSYPDWARDTAYRWARCYPGVKPKEWRATFNGRPVCPITQQKPPFWRVNYFGKQVLYSVYHLSDSNLKHYIHDIENRNFTHYYGYPSAIYLVGKYILEQGINFKNSPKVVFAGSEECQPLHREIITKAFNTQLRDCYHQGEDVALAFDCECGQLHNHLDYSYVEFNKIGSQDSLDVCEIIGTTFINGCWPLLRYRVGDLALIDPNAKCSLGKHGKIIKRVFGRTAHILLTKDKRRIFNITNVARKCKNIREIQAYQERIGCVTLRIVSEENYDKINDERLLLSLFREIFGSNEQMEVNIEYLRDIPRTSNGKFLTIVSKIGYQG